MFDSTFHHDLDALVRGESMTSTDDLTRFVADLYVKEGNVTIPTAQRLRIASELGISPQSALVAPTPQAVPADVFPKVPGGSSRWIVVSTIAAVLVIGVIGLCQLGVFDDNDSDQFLNVPPAVPTVEASPQSVDGWLLPVSANECPEEDLVDRGTWFAVQEQQAAAYTPVDRIDAPYSVPASEDASAVVARQRQALACANSSSVGNADALVIEAPRRSWEISAEGAEQSDAILRDRIARSEAFSQYVEDDLGLSANDLFYLTDGEQGLIWSPSNAVQLADGRIALIPSWVSNSAAPERGFDGFAPVWMNVAGKWLVDEELYFCIGDCEAYWTNLEALLPEVVQATPEPALENCGVVQYVVDAEGPINLRPEPGIRGDAITMLEPGTMLLWLCESQISTDPESDGMNEDQEWMLFRTQDGTEGWLRELDVRANRSWMLPIVPEECITESSGTPQSVSGEEFDAFPPREYVVIGPADPNQSTAASQSIRQFTACDYTHAIASDQNQVENNLSANGRGFSPSFVVQMDRAIADGRVVSEVYQDAGFKPGDFQFVIGGDSPGFEQVEEGTYMVPNSQLAMTLEDGRIVVPMVEVTVGRSDTSSAVSLPNYAASMLVMVDDEGSWKVDDVLPLCVGDCNDIWSYFSETLDINIWLLPINSQECDANRYLPRDLDQADSAAARSRQFRACEQIGNESILIGPDYRVTEGEEAQPLSMKIEELYRQTSETPGSLQRIVNPNRIFEDMSLPLEPWMVYQPSSVVTLADGRIAVLESIARSSETVGTTSGRTNPVVTTALVWIVDGNDWLLDEQVTVCLGDCDSFWGTAPATPKTTADPDVPLEGCVDSDSFRADFTSHALMPTHLRPGPGNGTGVSVVTLPAGTSLQYLCEQQPTADPVKDRMDEGQVWLKVRTEDGTEGWIRIIDIATLPAWAPVSTPAASTPVS